MSKQGRLIGILFVDRRRPHHHHHMPSTLPIEATTSSIIILLFTAAVAATLRLLPYEYIGGNRVPSIIFKGRPSMFHAFLVAVMFSFSGAFSALFVHNKPTMARLCRIYSTVSMVAAAGLLLVAAFSQTP